MYMLKRMLMQNRELKLIRRLQLDARGLPFIRLPKALVAALGWEKGDPIEIRLVGRGTLELRRLPGERKGRDPSR